MAPECIFGAYPKKPWDFEELRPAEPYSKPLDKNWEADAKKWEAAFRDWETLARISNLQTKVIASIMDLSPHHPYHCKKCGMQYGLKKRCLCKCRLLAMVDEALQGELESLSTAEHAVQLQ